MLIMTVKCFESVCEQGGERIPLIVINSASLRVYCPGMCQTVIGLGTKAGEGKCEGCLWIAGLLSLATGKAARLAPGHRCSLTSIFGEAALVRPKGPRVGEEGNNKFRACLRLAVLAGNILPFRPPPNYAHVPGCFWPKRRTGAGRPFPETALMGADAVCSPCTGTYFQGRLMLGEKGNGETLLIRRTATAWATARQAVPLACLKLAVSNFSYHGPFCHWLWHPAASSPWGRGRGCDW